MAQAQNKDPGAVKQGRMRAAVAFAKERIPGTKAYQERQSAAALQKAKEEASLKGQTNIDESKIDGNAATAFNKHLVAAIRTGHDELSSDEERSPANLIREVVTRREFISVIQNCTLPSPHEEVDEEYKASMTKRRQNLARELYLAANNPKYMINDLETADLDIIYSAFLGTAPYQSTNSATSIWENKMNPDGSMRYPGWPANLPMPPRAFFIFMESVARLQAKGQGEDVEKQQGMFIGNVCKFLAWKGMRTFSSKQGAVLRQLVDQDEIERYINGRSTEPIEAAVSRYIAEALRLFQTPTDQMDPLGCPGLGYTTRYEAEMAQLGKDIEDAKARLAIANLAREDAMAAEAHALEEMDAAQTANGVILEAVQKAGREGKAMLGNEVRTYDELVELQDDANATLNRLAKEVSDARVAHQNAEALAVRAENAYNNKLKDAQAHMESANPEALAQILGSEFRSFLENRGGDIESVTKAAEAVDRMPNTLVTGIVEKGEELLKMKAVLPTHFQKEPLGDGERDYLNDVMLKLSEIPGYFDTGSFGDREINSLMTAARIVGMLPARYGAGQLSDDDNRQLAAFAIALQRLPARFQLQREVRAERIALEQKALQPSGGAAMVPAEGVLPMEMAVKKVEMVKAEESQIAVANMTDLERVVGSTTARLQRVLELDAQVQEEDRTFGYVKKQYFKELADFKRMIDDAELPGEVKDRMMGVHMLLDKREPLSDVEKTQILPKMLSDLRHDYGHPLRKAAERSVERLKTVGYGQHAGLGNIAWVNARIVFQEHGGGISETLSPTPGRWDRFKAAVARMALNLVSGSWYSEKLGSLYDRLIGDDVAKILQRNRWHREIEIVKNRNGSERVAKKWPNAVRGVGNLTFRFYLLTAIAGYMMARDKPTQGLDYINPVHWAGKLAVTPLTQWLNKGEVPRVKRDRPFLVKAFTPWTWSWDYVDQKPQSFIINDHPSNFKTLTERGEAYYRQYYGVGTQDVQGGTSTKAERLAWVKKHPDVLKFFQERIDGYRVLRVKPLREEPNTCVGLPKRGKKAKAKEAPELEAKPDQKIRLPRSCTDKPFNLTTRGQVLEWKYGKKTENWELGRDKLCCVLKLTITTDGMSDRSLKLNPVRADAVVDWLMATEKGGQRIDYKFLTKPDNMRRWKGMWFLVSSNEQGIVKDHGLTQQDSVRFLMFQGSGATSMFYPVCAKNALSPKLLLASRRDDFVKAWMAELVKLKPGLKPMDQEASAEDLKAAFKKTEEANPSWFSDRTLEYKRHKVMTALPWLKLTTDEAKDVLADKSNKDLLELVKRYEKASYLINTGRSDDYVLLLAAEKRRLGAAAVLSTYDPFKQSRQLAYALDKGFLIKAVKSSGTKADTGSTLTEGPSTLPKSATYSEDTSTFYESNKPFSRFVDEIIQSMFKSRVQNRLMEGTLKKVFENNRDNMNNAIKAHLLYVIENKQANIHMLRVNEEEGKKVALFPPQGHRSRDRTAKEIAAKIQQLLAPLFAQEKR